MPDKKFKEVTAARILELMEAKTPVVNVDIARDMLPGGLSSAMFPLLVRWGDSSAGFGPDDFYIVRYVNVGTNPVGGRSYLASVKVYADSIESVEFVMVTSKVAKVETAAGHGMLRFIFKDGRRPVTLDNNGNPLVENAVNNDLVISWEAWRPPAASFDAVAGLDPETYALTPRCFLGPVRCLVDSILDRPWTCYPLKLPNIENAGNELLYVSLTLADAVARQTFLSIMDQRIEKGRNMPDDYPDPELNEWEKIAEEKRKVEVPENPIQDILDGKIKYHLLQRSCITMALSSIDWANHRIHYRGGLAKPKPIRVAPQEMPGFISKLANGKRASTLIRIPSALHWLMTNHTVIPGKAFELLDEVGLLQRENGVIKKYHYDNRHQTPYGEIADHLIF